MIALTPRSTPGAQVERLGEHAWRLAIPAGPAGQYRLAQVDDYSSLPRRAFLRREPFRLSLRARASASDLPGTWGFGLWNDPFSFSLGVSGMARRFPVLPEAAWFFYASPPNHLSFHDALPAQGFLAATFRSTRVPTWLMAPGALAAPFLALPWLRRLLRRALRSLVNQDAALIVSNPTAWREYALEWQVDRVLFWVGGEQILETRVGPRSPLGLVLWLDNQYAAFPPNSRLAYGMLANPQPAWLELIFV